MTKKEIKDAIDFAVSEMKASETTKTHEVVSGTKVEFQGTKDGCKLYVAANGPFAEILGEKLKIRKIK